MKILITGGAGFIGSHIVDSLIGLGHHVIVIDNLSTGNKNNINPKAKLYEADIRDPNIHNIFAFEQPEVVYHMAAQIDVQQSLKQPQFDGNVNILGTINILECCRINKVKKIIYPSSAAVYGIPKYLPINEDHPIEPISFYGISKHTPEHYFKVYHQLYDLNYTIFRYSNAYGIRQDPKGEGGVISIFMEKMLNGKPPTIFGTGDHTRDYIYVKDIVAANIMGLEEGNNQIINISTNTKTSLIELFTTMRKIMDFKEETHYGPKRKGDISHSVLDNAKAKDILGWEPQFSLEQGLKETIEYYRICSKN